MGRIRKFATLPPAERRLLLHATAWLAFVRLGLWLVPVRLLRRLAGRLAPRRAARRSAVRPPKERIVWAVSTASRVVPRATCLTQALATQALLDRYGYTTQLRIGVAKSDTGALEAHAWVECDGQILVGNLRTIDRFVPLPPLSGRAP
ncbi:MAG TPA: lasso peptide biosynthesis B2 protein [Gemmatimonadales bacterium]